MAFFSSHENLLFADTPILYIFVVILFANIPYSLISNWVKLFSPRLVVPSHSAFLKYLKHIGGVTMLLNFMIIPIQ